MSFLDGGSGLSQVGLRIAIVGVGMGLFQASAYTLMMSSVPHQRFGTAAAALSLAQAFGTVLSVAVIGGIFTLSEDHHVAGLAADGIASAEASGKGFILAFQDVFRLGAAIVALGACVFLFSPREGQVGD